jgi:hypothetical protein
MSILARSLERTGFPIRAVARRYDLFAFRFAAEILWSGEISMSADPTTPTDNTVRSGGYVVKNMIYTSEANGAASGDLEVFAGGWGGNREPNQTIVPPARVAMAARHPCAGDNEALLRCSLGCEPVMRLAGRAAQCHAERKLLQRCLVVNSKWEALDRAEQTAAAKAQAARPWWQLW